jgi:N-acetylglutamate synthase
MTRAQAWQVEQACLNAWPALRSAVFGPWLLRFGEGLSRRTNSVNPMSDGAATIAADLGYFAELYAEQGFPLIVRLPTLLSPAVGRELEACGFAPEGETCTLYRDLAGARVSDDPDVTIGSAADAHWLAAIARLQQQSPVHAPVYARVIDAIALPTGFVSLRRDETIVAAAYGVLHDGLLVCESVVVDAALRGHGLGRRLMHALFAWAISNGAKAVCLQVVADNTAGRALYASLGFETELYRYSYMKAAAK